MIACLALVGLISPGVLLGRQVDLPAASEAAVPVHEDGPGVVPWTLWEGYKRGFLEESGRIVEHDEGARTTSEAEAYGLFFALVADDRAAFDRILQWTQTNLAGGDLRSNLPGWLWGCASDGGWRVLDKNSASDADLWMAYTLIQAGRLWDEPGFTKLGAAIAGQVAGQSVTRIAGVGTLLLPAPVGFNSKDSVELNPSYMPVQLLYGLAAALPDGPWCANCGEYSAGGSEWRAAWLCAGLGEVFGGERVGAGTGTERGAAGEF